MELWIQAELNDSSSASHTSLMEACGAICYGEKKDKRSCGVLGIMVIACEAYKMAMPSRSRLPSLMASFKAC